MTADDALARLRAANPVPDPDRLAVAGGTAEPADPELRELLDRARRVKADETDDELFERREADTHVTRPAPLRVRRSHRAAWTAAAAVVALVASAVVWTASRGATPDVDVVDQPPPAPAEEAPLPAGAESTCTGDGAAGFAVGPDGAMVPGEPPQGELFTDKGVQRSRDLLSIEEASIRLNRGTLVASFVLPNPANPPSGEVWHTLWLRSPDGAATGVIRARGPGLAFEQHEVLAGPDLDELTPVDARITSGTQASGAVGGPTRLLVPADALPLMGEPFRWALEVRDLELGAGDICPSAVDPEDPFSDPDALARFPADEPSGG